MNAMSPPVLSATQPIRIAKAYPKGDMPIPLLEDRAAKRLRSSAPPPPGPSGTKRAASGRVDLLEQAAGGCHSNELFGLYAEACPRLAAKFPKRFNNCLSSTVANVHIPVPCSAVGTADCGLPTFQAEGIDGRGSDDMHRDVPSCTVHPTG